MCVAAIHVALPSTQCDSVPRDHAPRLGTRATTHHDDIVPVSIERSREQRSDLPGSTRNDDSHTHLPVTYMSAAVSQSCATFRIMRPQSKQIEPAGNLSRSSK